MNSITYVGCCGAYCKTCKQFIEGLCKGCKLGYAEGRRDLDKAKCKMKVCCLGERKLETCADCQNYTESKIIQDFHCKSGFKYKKYKESLEFIRKNGYSKFLKLTNKWKGAYGKLQ